MAEEAALDLLRRLASDFNVRDARKLHQIAKREFPDQPAVTVNRARDALRGDVARQVLAPKPRSLGKSAAKGPNDRLQADLIDFSQNTRSAKKYGLVVTDVFTRELVTRALPNKNADTVARAAAEAILDLVQDEGNYVVTTDEGNEFPHPGGEPTAGRSAPPEAAPGTGTPPPWWTAPSRRLRRTSRVGRPRRLRHGGLQREAARGRACGAGRRGDSAGDTLQGVPRQCREIPAQQGIDGGQAEAPPASGRFQGPRTPPGGKSVGLQRT